MLNILNEGALALMSSLGHRTRLFDVMSDLPPSTSEQIADAAELNERYVREWLGAMVAGSVVDYDPENKTYQLPPEHTAFLIRSAAPDNMAVFAQYIPLLYTISAMHCMTVSLAGNGAGLGTMWGEEKAREMLQEAGFTKIDVKKLPHDFQNAFYIIQKN